MKELKFRAWDIDCHRFEYFEIGENDDCYGIFRVASNKFGSVIEQYTGLKDKNGKEICENDIVNLEYYVKPFGKKRWNKTYPRKGSKDINVVGFEDGYFKFHQEDKDGYGSELAFSDYGEWEVEDGSCKYVAEVIGNIHENPELLEEEE